MPTEVKLKITCRIEEVPALGHFLLASMGIDVADFTGFSPMYDAAYITAKNAELVVIEGLINPKELTAELKVITKRIYDNQTALRKKIDFLEGYIKRATGLTVAAKDFGISAIRKANNKGDIEGLTAALGYTLGLTGNATNLPLLVAKGYSAAKQSELTTIRGQLTTDNTAQNNKVNARNNKVVANYNLINDFWVVLTDISDAGKRIFKGTNKLDDYTMSKLMGRIRAEQSRTLFVGTTNVDGVPTKGVKLTAVPVAGGTKKKATSRTDGGYTFKDLDGGTAYLITATATGKPPMTQTATAVGNGTVTVNFNLV